jgi:hypothetical protein
MLLATAALAVTASAAFAAPVGGKFQVRHVFVIVLENESAAVTFGPDSPAHYLSKTLPARGGCVSRWDGESRPPAAPRLPTLSSRSASTARGA